jgi:hypothetical protein
MAFGALSSFCFFVALPILHVAIRGPMEFALWHGREFGGELLLHHHIVGTHGAVEVYRVAWAPPESVGLF